jgi:hypothetical protein
LETSFGWVVVTLFYKDFPICSTLFLIKKC